MTDLRMALATSIIPLIGVINWTLLMTATQQVSAAGAAGVPVGWGQMGSSSEMFVHAGPAGRIATTAQIDIVSR